MNVVVSKVIVGESMAKDSVMLRRGVGCSYFVL